MLLIIIISCLLPCYYAIIHTEALLALFYAYVLLRY